MDGAHEICCGARLLEDEWATCPPASLPTSWTDSQDI